MFQLDRVYNIQINETQALFISQYWMVISLKVFNDPISKTALWHFYPEILSSVLLIKP